MRKIVRIGGWLLVMETKIPPGEGDSVGWRRTGCSVHDVAHVRNLRERYRHCWVSLVLANVNIAVIINVNMMTFTFSSMSRIESGKQLLPVGVATRELRREFASSIT